VRRSIQIGNSFVWANPSSIAPILRASARQRAKDNVVVDWNQERQRVRQKLLREEFTGKKQPLNAEDQARLDQLEEAEILRIESRIQSEQVPALMAKEERFLTYAEQITAALCVLALNPKNVEMSIRVLAPLPE
jgi:hypothetical protein